MVRTTKKERVGRERVLYDQETVERLADEYGPATEVKHNVKTTARVYEIRAAQWYWLQNKGCPRRSRASHASAKVWKVARAVDNGNTEVNFDAPRRRA